MQSLDKNEVLNSCANWLKEKRLESPAILFLEMHRPLRSLAHSGALMSAPILGALFGFSRINEIVSLLEEEANVETLISLLESRG